MSEILAIWQSGGWVMIPLFVLSVLLYGQVFQLGLYVRRVMFDRQSELHWWEWVRSPASADGRVAEVIRYTQDTASTTEDVRGRFAEIQGATLAMIDRRTRFLGTLVAAAPLLGLLGTVLGMLQTFLGISTSGGNETTGVVAAIVAVPIVVIAVGVTVCVVVVCYGRRRATKEPAAVVEGGRGPGTSQLTTDKV